MFRVLRAAVVSVLGTLTLVSVAMAATPVSNGVYANSGQSVIVALRGSASIHAFDVTCHAKTWVAKMFIPVRSGRFSYRGPDLLAKNGRMTKTAGSMTASGVFETSRLIVGRASAGGCSVSYRATLE